MGLSASRNSIPWDYKGLISAVVTSSATMSAVKNIVEKQIAEHPVVVYSKSMSLIRCSLFSPSKWWVFVCDYSCVVLFPGRWFGLGLMVGWCPYCRQAKATLADFGASYQVYELDQIGIHHHPFTRYIIATTIPSCATIASPSPRAIFSRAIFSHLFLYLLYFSDF
jgi:glutaredoxin